MLKEYKVIKEIFPLNLEYSVNQAINEGWIPVGGVSTYFENGQNYLIQSLVHN